MNDFFELCFTYLLKDEGSVYTNDPRDSGGPTKFGITQRSYEEYVGRITTITEIKDMTIDVAKAFYLEKFWKPLHCDQLTRPSIAACLFDSAVLYGAARATILAQQALSLCGATIKFDGVLGIETLKLLNLVKSDRFLDEYRILILNRIDTLIKTNPKDEVYREGWTNRANRILTLANLDLLIDKDPKT